MLSLMTVRGVTTGGADIAGEFSFSHRLPGDQISWLRFLMHKFNGDSETSSEIFVVDYFYVYKQTQYASIKRLITLVVEFVVTCRRGLVYYRYKIVFNFLNRRC